MKSQQGCDLLALTGGDILTDGDMSQRNLTQKLGFKNKINTLRSA